MPDAEIDHFGLLVKGDILLWKEVFDPNTSKRCVT